MKPMNMKLEIMFHELAQSAGKASMALMEDGLVTRMTRAGVLIGPMAGSENMKKGEVVQYRPGIELLPVSVPENVKPELMLKTGRVYLEKKHIGADIAYVNVLVPSESVKQLCVVRVDEESKTMDVISQLSMSTLDVSCQTMPTAAFRLFSALHKYVDDIAMMQPNIGLLRAGNGAVMVLHGEDSLLMTTLVNDSYLTTDKYSFLIDGARFVWDGWNEETKSWRKIIKERKVKMKSTELGRPSNVNGVKAVVKPLTADNATPEEMQAVSQQVAAAPVAASVPEPEPDPGPAQEPAPVPAVETVLAAEIVPQETPGVILAASPTPSGLVASAEPGWGVLQQEQEAKEQEAKESEAKEPDKVVKPRVRKSQKVEAPVLDYAKITEALGADIDVQAVTGNMKAALDEVRMCRDMGIAALRRMANIATVMEKAGEAAVASMASIKELLK